MIGTSYVIQDINELSDILVDSHEFNCLQFSVNPTMISATHYQLDQPTTLLIDDYKKHGGLMVFHSKYIYNFCRPNVQSQIESLIQDINIASKIGCDVVIHQGKNVKSEQMSKLHAINNYVTNITDVINQTSDCDTCILLENSAGQGSELGYTLDELTYIYNQFDDDSKQRIAFCIDTCHIFTAGELDMRRVEAVEHFLRQFDESIGINKLKCIHFNDSGSKFSGKRDIHADIMGGYISNPLMGGSCEGLKYLAIYASDHHIPLIFETPCTSLSIQEQLEYVKKWVGGT